MIVKISNYGDENNRKFVEYSVSGLLPAQMDYLMNNLSENIVINENILIIKMYFDEKLYPFQSDVAQFRIDDFIVREEIEMFVFLSSFLEDMV